MIIHLLPVSTTFYIFVCKCSEKIEQHVNFTLRRGSDRGIDRAGVQHVLARTWHVHPLSCGITTGTTKTTIGRVSVRLHNTIPWCGYCEYILYSLVTIYTETNIYIFTYIVYILPHNTNEPPLSRYSIRGLGRLNKLRTTETVM